MKYGLFILILFCLSLPLFQGCGSNDTDVGLDIDLPYTNSYIVLSPAKTCQEVQDPDYTGQGSVAAPRIRYSKIRFTWRLKEFLNITSINLTIKSNKLSSGEYSAQISGDELDAILHTSSGCPYIADSYFTYVPASPSPSTVKIGNTTYNTKYATCSEMYKLGEVVTDSTGTSYVPVLPDQIQFESDDSCSLAFGGLDLSDKTKAFRASGEITVIAQSFDLKNGDRPVIVRTSVTFENIVQ